MAIIDMLRLLVLEEAHADRILTNHWGVMVTNIFERLEVDFTAKREQNMMRIGI